MTSIAKLLLLTSIIWVMPPRYWHRFAELGGHGDKTRRALRESKFQVIGMAGPWRRWRPAIRVHGEAHLKAALNNGCGAILWAGNFIYSDLIYKIALYERGYSVTQLYRPAHGFGRTKFELRFLNPLWQAVEGRFLRQRVMIHGNDTKTAVNILQSRLNENGIVAIYFGNEARRTTDVPFRNQRVRAATGPVAIASRTGAALLPLFAVRNDDGVYDVTIEKPLQIGDEFNDVAAAMARRHEPYAGSHPEQWRVWNELME